MKIGTKSLLFGAHQFLLHPFYVAVAVAWSKIWGSWPTWKEIVCILVHDWGYFGCPDIDGLKGTNHPKLGAQIAMLLFGEKYHDLCAYHSRAYAKLQKSPVSKLCAADKGGVALMPKWPYLLLAESTGEIQFYREDAAEYDDRTGKGCPLSASNSQWHDWVVEYMLNAAKKTAAYSAMDDIFKGVITGRP